MHIQVVISNNVFIQVSIQVEGGYNVPFQVTIHVISNNVPIQVVTADKVLI